MRELNFNKIYVIESLGADDKKTGQMLYHDIIKIRLFQKELFNNCELIFVNSKAEFLKALDHIREETIHNLVNPIIHLECHGSKTGLEMNNGATVTWSELQFRLSELNLICGCNLFITLATCYGGYIYTAIKPSLRSPFWGYVGAFEEVYYPEILSDFHAFYDEFLQSLNINTALTALNKANNDKKSQFRFQNTEFAFKVAYENYEKKYLTPEEVEKRLETGLIEARKFPEMKNWTDEAIKSSLQFMMVNLKDKLKEDMMTNFFMWDLFPENKEN